VYKRFLHSDIFQTGGLRQEKLRIYQLHDIARGLWREVGCTKVPPNRPCKYTVENLGWIVGTLPTRQGKGSQLKLKEQN